MQTNHSEGEYLSNIFDHKEKTNISLIVTYSIVILIGVIGNAIVISKFTTSERRKMAGSTMIVTLAVNDFFASIFVPLFQINDLTGQGNWNRVWHYGHVLCIFLPGIQLVSITASSWILVAISFERLM